MASTGRTSILVIQADERTARLVDWTLRIAGFGVLRAAEGVRGLMLARERPFALVVLDLALPDLAGLDVLAALQKCDPRRPVLVVAPDADADCIVECFELGACDVVASPFALAELVARVRARLRERGMDSQSRLLRRNGYELDLQRHTVANEAGVRRLTTREFVLLEHLMRRSGAACSREELHEAVWGYTYDPSTNVLDVYVARLRSKLGHESIDTVRNVGYAFVGARAWQESELSALQVNTT